MGAENSHYGYEKVISGDGSNVHNLDNKVFEEIKAREAALESASRKMKEIGEIEAVLENLGETEENAPLRKLLKQLLVNRGLDDTITIGGGSEAEKGPTLH